MELWHFIGNIVVAMLLGVAIGVERQLHQHAAGLRTNALVCLGAALFVSLAHMENDPSSTRMASYVVSGIGFIGGGVILREGLNVRGLNTAATIWCSGAVGTLAGMGYLPQAALGTGSILLLNVGLRPLVRRIEARAKSAVDVETTYRVRVVCASEHEGVIRTIFMRHINAQPGMTVQGISTVDAEQPDKSAVAAEIYSASRSDKYMNELVSRLSIEPNVTAVSWDRES
jgi:putative Mg2+ transporter-C (MgtC) family protein